MCYNKLNKIVFFSNYWFSNISISYSFSLKKRNLSIDNKIKTLVENATASAEYSYITLGTIPNFQAQEIAAATKVIVRSSDRVIDSDGIIHTLSGHGNDKKEQERGQVGVKHEDFELIPLILNSPDSYSTGNQTNRRKEACVVFIKKIAGRHYHVVMAVIQGKNHLQLVLKTMYIKK